MPANLPSLDVVRVFGRHPGGCECAARGDSERSQRLECGDCGCVVLGHQTAEPLVEGWRLLVADPRNECASAVLLRPDDG